ncbi:MAG: hypothetical protein LBP63_10835 [Prevotellaceae bacterium]|jgi:hypothetical protein|nr:hypothetical protein [Prevotellaceae bacterium]
MIVTTAIFEGEITIGQLEYPDRQAQVQWFINQYEPKYLAKLLGLELATELLTEYAKEVHAEKWNILANKVKMAAACYIYFYFQKDSATASVGAGVIEMETENGTHVNNEYKMLNAWNRMVGFSIDFPFWIDRTEYPAYKCVISDINVFKNTFGL